MAGQPTFFKKSRRAGKSASSHIILKYGGAICFSKNQGGGNPHLFTLYQNMAGQSAFSKNQGGQGSPHPYKLYQ